MTQDTGSSSGIGIGRVLLAVVLVGASLFGGYLLISAPSREDPSLALDPPQANTPKTTQEEVAKPVVEPTPETQEQTTAVAAEDQATSEVPEDQASSEDDGSPVEPETKTEQGQEAVAETGEVVTDGADEVSEPVDETETEVNPQSDASVLSSPSFDVVRVDSAGNAVVAGQASAGQTVHIYLDDEEVLSTTVSPAGDFVGLFEIPPSVEGQALTIEIEDSAGVRRPAEATALISPFGQPEEVPSSDELLQQAEVDEAATEDAPPAEEEEPAEVAAIKPEPAKQPSVLIVNEDGARPAQPSPAPSAPKAPDRVNVVIDTISYDAKGDVILVGRGLGGAFLRLYLNNALWTSGEVDETGGWQIRLIDVSPGVYTLRVDELDDGGRVTSRFETPFQREAPEVAIAALRPEKSVAPARLPQPGVAPAPASASSPQAHSGPKAAIVTVQPGFTLWGIANKRYGDGLRYVQVYEDNIDQIRDPDLIYPGQVFSLPAE